MSLICFKLSRGLQNKPTIFFKLFSTKVTFRKLHTNKHWLVCKFLHYVTFNKEKEVCNIEKKLKQVLEFSRNL